MKVNADSIVPFVVGGIVGFIALAVFDGSSAEGYLGYLLGYIMVKVEQINE